MFIKGLQPQIYFELMMLNAKRLNEIIDITLCIKYKNKEICGVKCSKEHWTSSN